MIELNYFWDILAVVFVVTSVVSCFKKGFMYSFVKTAGGIAAVVLSVVFSLPAAKSVYYTFFKVRITAGFEKMFSSIKEIDMAVFQNAVNEKLARLPGTLGDQMAPVFNEYAENWFESFVRADFSSLAENFVRSIAEPVITGFLRCIIFLLMFLILSFAVKLLASLFKGVKYIPVLGSLNAVLGSVLGLIEGIIHVIMLCAVIWVVLNFTGGIEGIMTREILNQTYVLRAVFNVFPILGGILTQI